MFNKPLTLFKKSFDENLRLDTYKKEYIEKAYVHIKNKAKVSDEGSSDTSVFYILIPLTKDLLVKPGDVLVLGKCASDTFSKKDMMLVTSVSVNDFGINKHLKIEAR